MRLDDSTPPGGEWEDWAEVAAADPADPAFRALVEEIDVDQHEWAREYTATLAARRKALSVTQAEVAARLGATQPEVSKIEHRDDVPVSTGSVTHAAQRLSGPDEDVASDGEHEDQVEEQLQRCDPLLVPAHGAEPGRAPGRRPHHPG